MEINKIYLGDAGSVLKSFPSESIDCCVTSPPYYNLRDYDCGDLQIGLENSPEEYIKKLVAVFEEVRRVLKPEGTLWIIIGDSYSGGMKGAANYKDNAMNYKQGTNRGSLGVPSIVKKGSGYKPKDLIGIPWMLAFELRSRGWFLRQDIIWHKPNPMPESVRDRCTKAHEYIFLLSKSRNYYFDCEAIAEPVADATLNRLSQDIDSQKGGVYPGYEAKLKAMAPRYGGNKYTATPDKFYRTKSVNAYQPRARRNKRDVWTVSTKGFKGDHFATFPQDLIQPCILSACPEGGIVLDPFIGSGTTALVARRLLRNFVGVELNQDYVKIANRRINETPFLF